MHDLLYGGLLVAAAILGGFAVWESHARAAGAAAMLVAVALLIRFVERT